ncbi:TadE family type IV pilus minor pilin [Kocuria marina]|uniref:TadE family type IV pilus minor pilin n=1 Tax=Kocuria marina TaxID=223184 RepID=UPI0021B476C2|nr:TadE family type IV pilus minor pilin [Kocuria indica]
MRRSRTELAHDRADAPPGQPEHPPPHPDAGAVTVETAVMMPGLVLLLAVLLAAAAAGMTTVRYEEAARASARAAARGETAEVVERTAREIAGDTAVVRVSVADDRVTVAVNGPAPGILGTWSDWRLQATGSAAVDTALGTTGGPSAGPGTLDHARP